MRQIPKSLKGLTMYIEMNIKVDGNTYKIEKLEKWFGYWEFHRLISPANPSGLNRDLWEYMGSSTSPDFAGELSKIIGEYSGAGSGELFTLVELETIK